MYNEKILEDNYPVYFDYLYIADDKIVKSPIQGTIKDLKKILEKDKISCKIMSSCDIVGRQININKEND
jgi:hypothetical protein